MSIRTLLTAARACGTAFALVMIGAVGMLIANQSNTWSPTTGTVSGLQLTTNYNNAFSALLSSNSGSSAPANDQTAAAVKGQWWLDTTAALHTLKFYDGASWATVANLDTTNHAWIPSVSSPIETVASAGTADLCGTGVLQAINITISGTTTITSLGTSCVNGQIKIVEFQGILTLTNGGALILPGAANIATAAGDTMVAQYTSGTGWRVIVYQKASGAALVASANFTSTVSFNGVISPTALASNTNDWAPTGLATANVIRLSCSSVINLTGITAPVTDGQVLILDNIGATNNCVLTAQDTNSAAANRFAFDQPITLRPSRTVTIKYDATTVRWVLWQEIPVQLVAGGYKNLRLWNVADALGDAAPSAPNSQYRIAFDAAALEDANGGTKRIQGSVTVVDATGTNTVNPYICTADISTSGAGGLDTGSLAASTWYHVWAIFNPTANTASCILSTSSSAPTMPSGYTFKARFGAIASDSGTNKCLNRVQQIDRIAHYVAVASTPLTNCAADTGTGGKVIQNANTAGANASLTSPVMAATQVQGNGFPVPPTSARALIYTNNGYNGGGTGSFFYAPNQNFSGTNNGVSGTNKIVGHIGDTIGAADIWFDHWMMIESNSISLVQTGGANTATAVLEYEDNL
jgi:hypothetical protein